MIMTAIFTGLRASELRGLRWKNVDLKNAKLHVRERADRYLKMGEPKSESGERAVPLPPMIVNVLREHKLRTKADFVFPTDNGVQHHANILHRGFEPAQVAAGIVDEHGKPKYALHALRHFYASWCINRKQDGGLELPMKVVQERLGHSTINLTADVYGHLFPSNDDGDRTQRGPKVLCSLSATQTRHAARNINKNNALVQFCKPLVGSSILSRHHKSPHHSGILLDCLGKPATQQAHEARTPRLAISQFPLLPEQNLRSRKARFMHLAGN
jgi:integrase